MLYAFHFSHWKRSPLKQFFLQEQISFVTDISHVPSGATLVVWGMHPISDVSKRNISIIRLEDGFLRSIGLGADLIKPLSWVADHRGIYFDATSESDLEALLKHTSFTPELLERAAKLKKRIIEAGVTKYNTGTTQWKRPNVSGSIILVPGQVESDASLAYGAPGIKTNIGLLKAVREANPTSYLVYKPHPDVVAGMRAKGENEENAAQWCDEIVVDVSMGELLNTIDEVHCLTSLAGFEALLRGKKVTCYGQPFYASWGLTTDIMPLQRRMKVLSIDALTAGALILYPRYMSRKNSSLITPEEALSELVEWQAQSRNYTPWWRKIFRIILRVIVGVR